jgi:hypothetical protein
MKKIALGTILSLFTGVVSYGQGMFGAQAGIGDGTAYKPKITPAVEAYYLQQIFPRIYIGGTFFFQKYSFTNTLIKDTSNLNYGDVISIRQKSSYLFFCPKIDFGFGFHKYIHASLSFGPGLYMGGNQYTYQFQPFWTNTYGVSYGKDTVSTNTSYNIPKVIYRVAAGISERIPTHRYWNIMLSQEFTFLPGYISHGTPNMNTGYFCFQVGIMHKYPMKFVEY